MTIVAILPAVWIALALLGVVMLATGTSEDRLMTWAAFIVVVVAIALYAVRELVLWLQATRHGVDADFSIFRPYAKAPESAVQDDADREQI